ncbi:MAG TPA: DNA polymerase I [Polyangia bacterium]|nr:DNA polymerase I [Polyangia bacterium]
MAAKAEVGVPRPGALYLIDGSNYVFRAYFALVKSARPDQSTYLSTSAGLPTGAILVFTNMLMKLYLEHRPRYAAVVFDAAEKTFRDELYPRYKETRHKPADDLRPQFPYFPRIVEAFNLPMLKVPGVEADDVIATLTLAAQARGLEVVIWSGDKDLLQLCSDRVHQVDTLRDVEYTPAAVADKFGVAPEQLGDVLALMGDTSDNIPGVAGIGPGWAAKLVGQYGSLEAILHAAEGGEIKGKIGEALRNPTQRSNALLSRRLVELKRDVPGLPPIMELARREFDKPKLIALLRELEFEKLSQRIEAVYFLDRDHYKTVLEPAQLEAVLAAARAAGELALCTRTTSAEAARAELVGISLCVPGTPAVYVPIAHSYLGAPKQLARPDVLAALRPLLEDESIKKYAHDHKNELVVLARQGIELRGVSCDPMIASYLIDPSRNAYGLDALASDFLGHEMIRYEDLCGKGRAEKPFAEIDLTAATRFAAENAEATLLLGKVLYQRVVAAGMQSLLEDVELPLARLLAVIERHGVLLDVPHLSELAHSTGADLHRLEGEIHELAGYPINVNSPKQLQELLFDKLHLPSGKKTKTGASTDADVLEELATHHPIIPKILEYREISKLKGTYIDALPKLIDAAGRIHTSYNQAVAATGRLSSSDPNLQNIPIRSELGRNIRRAFIAPPGHVLLSADYSQIELRVLAHLSGDPILCDSFARDEDVHARTAIEVFRVEPQQVTAEMRRIAKAINYGLSYGQSDFGLARVLRIPKEEAHLYIERYFQRYKVLREFLEQLIVEARRTQVVTTILGRRRPLPGINAKRWTDRSYAERIARNTPMQGTAADILKVAMIRVADRLEAEKWPAKMLLTVHDELVFEVPEARASELGALAKVEMENVMALQVPLRVDVGSGHSWADAHG